MDFSAEGPHIANSKVRYTITRLSVVCPADREAHHGNGIHEAAGPEDWTVEEVHQDSSDDELKEAWRGLDPAGASVPWRRASTKLTDGAICVPFLTTSHTQRPRSHFTKMELCFLFTKRSTVIIPLCDTASFARCAALAID